MSSLKTINGIKPKNKRVERALLKREPKVFENVKNAMFLKGPKTSGIVAQALRDMYAIKKPHAVMLKKHNQKRPFEDETEIEFLSNKNDCSLFTFASHTKKRPNSLIIGRTFDHKILDMIEVGVENFKSIQDIGAFKFTSAVGSKPCFIFRGTDFEYKEEPRKFANLILDFFRGPVVNEINLEGLDHVIICTAMNDKIFFRHYGIILKKVEGSKLPKVELEEIGPSMDLVLRRNKFAPRDVLKEALKVPGEAKGRKIKNISTTPFAKLGRVHKGRQDLTTMQVRKMKGLKRKRGPVDSSSEITGGQEQEEHMKKNDNNEQQQQEEEEEKSSSSPSSSLKKKNKRSKKLN